MVFGWLILAACEPPCGWARDCIVVGGGTDIVGNMPSPEVHPVSSAVDEASSDDATATLVDHFGDRRTVSCTPPTYRCLGPARRRSGNRLPPTCYLIVVTSSPDIAASCGPQVDQSC